MIMLSNKKRDKILSLTRLSDDNLQKKFKNIIESTFSEFIESVPDEFRDRFLSAISSGRITITNTPHNNRSTAWGVFGWNTSGSNINGYIVIYIKAIINHILISCDNIDWMPNIDNLFIGRVIEKVVYHELSHVILSTTI